MENQPQAPAAAEAQRTPGFEAWMQARGLCLKHDREIDDAMGRRPVRSHPDWDSYQETVMGPLIAERDRLRAQEQEAKAAMNAT